MSAVRSLFVLFCAASASAFVVVPATGHAARPCATFSPSIALCAEAPDDRLERAAMAVVKAASLFGAEQELAATAWVEEAVRSDAGSADPSALLERQLALFEECVLDGEGDACGELDAALTDLEGQLLLNTAGIEEAGPVRRLTRAFGLSKLDRALARVRKAASKYGSDQQRFADAWTRKVRETRSGNPARFLEAQEALFGECLIDEDGGDSKCRELQDSLAAMQSALGVRGKVVSTAALR